MVVGVMIMGEVPMMIHPPMANDFTQTITVVGLITHWPHSMFQASLENIL